MFLKWYLTAYVSYYLVTVLISMFSTKLFKHKILVQNRPEVIVLSKFKLKTKQMSNEHTQMQV